METLVSKPLLARPWHTAERAAWELLFAIRELFPQVFEELEEIRDQFEHAYAGGAFEDSASADAALAEDVEEWTARHHIACPAVDAVALDIAKGAKRPESRSVFFLDKGANWLVGANPLQETLH